VAPPFAAVWGDFVEMITKRTAQGLNGEDVPSSTQKYAELFLLADALGRSRFLKTLIDDHNLLNQDRKEWAEKLKQRLGKVCQYLCQWHDASHTLSRKPSGFSRFLTVGSRTPSLALSGNYLAKRIVVVEKQSVKYKPLSTQLDDGNVT
jgi:hypothetical protein